MRKFVELKNKLKARKRIEPKRQVACTKYICLLALPNSQTCDTNWLYEICRFRSIQFFWTPLSCFPFLIEFWMFHFIDDKWRPTPGRANRRSNGESISQINSILLVNLDSFHVGQITYLRRSPPDDASTRSRRWKNHERRVHVAKVLKMFITWNSVAVANRDISSNFSLLIHLPIFFSYSIVIFHCHAPLANFAIDLLPIASFHFLYSIVLSNFAIDLRTPY